MPFIYFSPSTAEIKSTGSTTSVPPLLRFFDFLCTFAQGCLEKEFWNKYFQQFSLHCNKSRCSTTKYKNDLLLHSINDRFNQVTWLSIIGVTYSRIMASFIPAMMSISRVYAPPTLREQVTLTASMIHATLMTSVGVSVYELNFS